MVAVVGCQRSGTTLVGQILGARPGAVLIDEFDGLYPWFHATPAGAEAPPADLLTRAAAKYHDGDSRFRLAGGSVVLSPDVDVLVLKAPNLTYDEQALARFPVPVTVVYPVRDPRAVVASMERLDHIDFVGNQLRLLESRPRVLAHHAAEHAQIADEALPAWRRRAVIWRLKSGRAPDFRHAGLSVHALRYEDLVTHPESVLSPLLKACGFDAQQPAPPAHTVLRGLGPGATDRARPVDTASRDAWRDAATPGRQADILDAAQPLAGELGYA